MLITSIMASLCGVGAVLIAGLLVRNIKRNIGIYVAVVAVAFFALNGLSQHFVMPQVRALEARSEAREMLRKQKLFLVLASEHPEFSREFEDQVMEVARTGGSEEQAIAVGVEWGRKRLGPYFLQYAPHASDEALVNYFSLLLDILDGMDAGRTGSCSALLSGETHAAADAIASLGDEQNQELMDATADVFETAINNPQAPPEATEGEALTKDLVRRLARRHGQGYVAALAQLADPNGSGVDQARVCKVTIRMYRELLRLPDPKRGRLLRYLLANAHS